ncbi:hypothetical protein PHLGIDRAFT_333026 [Phlebiopsis gigantea 11061_1 CR5-6]|uniref:F-box domain-containing protein n=1 Tax=Phlebiopsis gigantea (strain 11061_1 CR5-6) TaxID=745531 RepID=A0A0C3PQG2_PHLG1|nr:hypothetical protein PHLGIDRAFT_333026 [Phlebiopsis gigantea 11061_1 CR5-6]
MFCVECQPRLFRVVQHSGTSDSAQHGRALQLWSNLLKEKDPRSALLAGFVQNYTLSSWYANDAFAQCYFTAFLERRMSTAHHFIKLKTFKMKSCQISSSTFDVLAQIPSVRALSFDGCVPNIESSLGDTHHSRSWTRFIAAQTFFPSECYPMLSDFIDIDGLEYLSVDDWSLACAILEGRRANQLRELCIPIDVSQAPEVPNFLERMPNLTRLCVRNALWSPDTCIPSHIVPRLQQLQGSVSFLNKIVPGRPVTHITISGIAILQRPFASAAKLSTVGIRSICLPQAHFRTLHSDDFPNLESLIIRPGCVGRSRLYSSAFPSALDRDSPLSSPTLVTYAVDPTCCWICAMWLLDLITQLVTLSNKVPAIFPHATRFRMANIIEWRRDPGQTWVPRVLSRPAARELLFRRDMRDVSDIDGCLRSLLRDDELTVDDRLRLGNDFIVHDVPG